MSGALPSQSPRSACAFSQVPWCMFINYSFHPHLGLLVSCLCTLYDLCRRQGQEQRPGTRVSAGTDGRGHGNEARPWTILEMAAVPRSPAPDGEIEYRSRPLSSRGVGDQAIESRLTSTEHFIYFSSISNFVTTVQYQFLTL